MNVQSVLGELEQLGYSISLDGENIRCKCFALIEPPREKVIPLLETLKGHKADAMAYLKGNKAITDPISHDTLKTLYLDAFNRAGWKIGLLARPEVTQAEDRLNQVWLDCMEGRADLLDFKETITEWEGVISGAIKKVANGS